MILGAHGAALLLCGALLALPTTTVPDTAPREAPALERLVPCRRALCQGERRFRWRGVTAFALLDLVADGKQQEARRFLGWAHETGFNVVRVLAMLPSAWFDLSAEDGRRALPALLTLAREHGMYVELVALANTKGRTEAFLREQVREVGRICASAPHCILEIANEPYHGTQADLDNPAVMSRLQREIPKQVPVAWGAARDYRSDVLAGGTFVTAHVARAGERWQRIQRMRDLESLSARTGKFVVDNEAIGAGEQHVRNRRDANRDFFFAQGVLSRIFEVGSNFHCEDCLHARVPGSNQQACADAFIAGSRLVPDDQILEFSDAPAIVAATAGASAPTSGARAFAAVVERRGWLALIGASPTTRLQWRNGWRPEKQIAARPGIEVWTMTR